MTITDDGCPRGDKAPSVQVVIAMRQAFEDDGFTATGGETNQSVLAD